MKIIGRLRNAPSAVAAGILLTCTVAWAQPPAESLTLADAVAIALENHSTVRAANLDVELAAGRLSEERAVWFPTISVAESITRGNNPVFVFGSLLEQAQFGPQNFDIASLNSPSAVTNFRTSITAAVSAFDGFRASARVKQAQHARTQAEFMKVMAEQRVRSNVVREYFGVLVAEAARDVAEESLEMAEADVELSRARLDAGLSVQSDFLGAQVQLAEFRQQRIQAAGELTVARARLNIAMGVPAGTVYRLPATISAARFQIRPQDELLQVALTRRADYVSAESAVAAAGEVIAEKRADYLPQVKFFGSLGSSGRSLSTGSADYAVGATLSVNVFDRGRSARLDQARIGKDLAAVELERVADLVRMDVITAYQSFVAAEERTGVAEASLDQATEALRIVRDRYTEGLNTITDLLRAETAVVRARLNVVSARHAYYTGYANVLFSAGLLDDVDAFAARGGNNE